MYNFIAILLFYLASTMVVYLFMRWEFHLEKPHQEDFVSQTTMMWIPLLNIIPLMGSLLTIGFHYIEVIKEKGEGRRTFHERLFGLKKDGYTYKSHKE